MTTSGRVVATISVAAVLVGLTVVAGYFLQAPETAPALTPPPASLETPTTTTEELGPAAQEPADSDADEAAPSPAAAPEKTVVTPPVGPAVPSQSVAAAGPSEGVAPAGPAVAGSGPGATAADEGLAMVSDRPVEAQKRLSEALRAGVDGAKAVQVHEAINRLGAELQFSPQRHRDDKYSKAYQVASGDTLTGIGQRHVIPYELVMRLNRLSSPSIAADQTLKVIQGPMHVEILKGRHELRVWLGEACVRVYPVGMGADNSTPDGVFLVRNKIRNPPYQPQHRTRSDFRASGAPDNPLGSRWIDIGNHYGIHGTIEPESIGRNVSEGCIRMHNKDVEELYDMVVVGASKVTIRP